MLYQKKDLKATLFSTTGGQIMDEICYSAEGVRQLCALMGEDITLVKNLL